VLPLLQGAPIRVEMGRALGPHLAQTSIPARIIYLDPCLLEQRGDFERILVHEIFHFVWVRLGNPRRWDWERLLEGELRERVRGELGWSAEWRKLRLKSRDIRGRTSLWRHYACESFCDSAARLYSGLTRHEEFTLPARAVRRRAAWMERNLATSGVWL
jgi:hypothetical protein